MSSRSNPLPFGLHEWLPVATVTTELVAADEPVGVGRGQIRAWRCSVSKVDPFAKNGATIGVWSQVWQPTCPRRPQRQREVADHHRVTPSYRAATFVDCAAVTRHTSFANTRSSSSAVTGFTISLRRM